MYKKVLSTAQIFQTIFLMQIDLSSPLLALGALGVPEIIVIILILGIPVAITLLVVFICLKWSKRKSPPPLPKQEGKSDE